MKNRPGYWISMTLAAWLAGCASAPKSTSPSFELRRVDSQEMTNTAQALEAALGSASPFTSIPFTRLKQWVSHASGKSAPGEFLARWMDASSAAVSSSERLSASSQVELQKFSVLGSRAYARGVPPSFYSDRLDTLTLDRRILVAPGGISRFAIDLPVGGQVTLRATCPRSPSQTVVVARELFGGTVPQQFSAIRGVHESETTANFTVGRPAAVEASVFLAPWTKPAADPFPVTECALEIRKLVPEEGSGYLPTPAAPLERSEFDKDRAELVRLYFDPDLEPEYRDAVEEAFPALLQAVHQSSSAEARAYMQDVMTLLKKKLSGAN